ncbi:MAG TPA: alpha/beta hydrolase [Flavihumibacter sp.]|nr:alpha/beta hydrolase [Bacteroidota bacterium]HOA37072.1 alpha/beta hydrolase [Flavihumibacter sp.]HPZ87522.1 alpha/beta hydrolase [Flavihumibacter sp.]HQD08427.1 alpha/beta hydrolase [Flavihumibacter sp.]
MPKQILMTCLLLAVLATACQKTGTDNNTTNNQYNADSSYSLQNIAYGTDGKQVMDIYLPAHRAAATTKVFVLVHGGGWSEGDKSEFNDTYNTLKTLYPNYAIANLNYRLGTATSPGYPKQIDDIKAAIAKLKSGQFGVSNQYFMVGASAGAHLSMLYSYGFDDNKEVKAVCNVIGPADLTDPAYAYNILYAAIYVNLVGQVTYDQNPSLYAEVSPAMRVTTSSPATISFYGDQDPVVPVSQMPRLHNALSAKGVYNEFTMYAGEGHGGWNQAHTTDMINKLKAFIAAHFN